MREPKIDPIFLNPYKPVEHETRLYEIWEKKGYFNPDTLVKLGVTPENAESFSIVLPPPNVTGILHMGSALMLVIEDIMIRQARMTGKRALWIPGTDSAAIATQARVEKDIQKEEEKTRYDLGREELLRRIDVFIEKNKATILNQMRKMGASLDWSRYAYTMDIPRYRAVMEAFVRMYKAGLIYRGNRIVNWDPKMQTTVSDDEIEHVEEVVPFYYFQYGPFTIGTARPETKFGDKYVVMHPDDVRYKEYIHEQKIDLEWINGPITATVIKDSSIDMEFGTGVMTITPAHSLIDFEIAERHGLDIESVIDDRGILLPIAGEFAGMHIKKARPLIFEKLKEKGLVVKVDEKYVHNLATNSRGGGTIEPQIKEQWFLDVTKEFTMEHSEIEGVPTGASVSLKKLMQHAVESGQVDILPERFKSVYYHWIDNLRDWCISRQIWFGHRIPIWYKGEEIYCGVESPIGSGWEQDPDVLDTWFSSSLWTFSTLGWPEKTKDLALYHPTTVLNSGYDILFFWIARMVLMSGFHLGQIPFKTVYLHGLVRDGKGQKISKSLGNNIDPLEMGVKYGTDAVRMSLIVGTGPGSDSKVSEDKIRAYGKFANKLWNIARFILSETEDAPTEQPTLVPEDAERLTELNALIEEVTIDFEKYRLYLAGEKLYHYVWHTVADVIIEERKVALQGADTVKIQSAQWLLLHILTTSLKLLHPLVPFVTEAIWEHLPAKDAEHLIIAKWPGFEK